MLQVSLLIRTYWKSSNDGVRDEFLEIVPEKYNDDELVEWEPAPPPISRPEEPGDLGILRFLHFSPRFHAKFTDKSVRF